jgi:hypothetical protein
MTLRYRAVSADGIPGREILLDDRVCDCCPTSGVAGPEGTLFIVYRDRSREEVRDISLVRVRGGSPLPPGPVHEDGWRIEGCPVNGPAVVWWRDGPAVLWYTHGHDDVPRVLFAFSGDGGETFSEPERVDDGNPLGRVALVVDARGDVLASWLEATEGGEAEIRLRRVGDTGPRAASSVLVRTTAGRVGGLPRLAAGDGRLLLAWTESAESTRVRTGWVR